MSCRVPNHHSSWTWFWHTGRQHPLPSARAMPSRTGLHRLLHSCTKLTGMPLPSSNRSTVCQTSSPASPRPSIAINSSPAVPFLVKPGSKRLPNTSSLLPHCIISSLRPITATDSFPPVPFLVKPGSQSLPNIDSFGRRSSSVCTIRPAYNSLRLLIVSSND